MTQDQYEEWVICGRLPRKKNRHVDLYVVERALRDEDDPSKRVSLLRRLLEEKYA